MGGLVLLAALLRLPTLGSPLLEDEGITFNRYIGLPWNLILLHYSETNQHSLFILIADVCIKLFGKNEIAYRIPSFLAGMFSVVLVYRVSLDWLKSRPTAVTAAVLLSFSTIHVKYSQEGRGYGLTVFLSLLLIMALTRILEQGPRWGWGSLLVISGFFLVLTLPSNAVFLVGAGIYYLMELLRKRNQFTAILSRQTLIPLIPFLVLFFLVAGYFAVIFPGLEAQAKLYLPALSSIRLGDIFLFLVSPWGIWFYGLFALGSYFLIRKKMFLPFGVLLLFPILMTGATGVVGFPRIYIYCLPFILIPSAYAIVVVIEQIREKNRGGAFAVALTILVGLLIQPTIMLSGYYSARTQGAFISNGPNPTLAEAEQAAGYIEEHFSNNDLILIMASGPQSSVLNHFLGDRIRNNMIDFAGGAVPKRILLVCHRKSPPSTYLFKRASTEGDPLSIPPHLVTLLKEIGDLQIYSLDLQIARLVPRPFDPDYEADLMNIPPSPSFVLKRLNDEKFIGERALFIRNNSEKTVSLLSPYIKEMNVLRDDTYILFVYVTKFGEKMMTLLADAEKLPPVMGYVNYYLGNLKLLGSNERWHVIYVLSSLEKGRHRLREILQIKPNQSAHLDGLQSFILTR